VPAGIELPAYRRELRILTYERIAAPLAKPGAPGGWMRSWRLMAIDAVQIDVPDSPANFAEFGKYQGGTRRPFPQIHAVGLGECGTHAVVAAELGTIYDGERKLARALLGFIEPDMLVIADRGYYAFDLWQQFMVTGASLLWRMPAGIKLPVLDVLPDGSYLSEINNKKTRSGSYRIPLSAVTDPRDATHISVRVIEYTVSGGDDTEEDAESEIFRLITSILDPQEASAEELAAAYQQRWEYEISLKEIETQLLASGRGLRSKSPEMVRQEWWGLLLTHYAIRKLMVEAADTAGLDPDRLSFIRTLNIVRRQVTNQVAFSPQHP
jgi:Transposase DDE domain